MKPERIKQERDSSVENSNKLGEKSKKNRKRKASVDSDSDNAPTKKVKSEPLSPLEVDEPVVPRIKREKISDSEDSTLLKLPASSKEKKPKKKKKRVVDSDDDDFETSLQNLLNSAIKTRK